MAQLDEAKLNQFVDRMLSDMGAALGFDQHPGSVGCEGLAHATRRVHGIAHVVETVEEGDEIDVLINPVNIPLQD